MADRLAAFRVHEGDSNARFPYFDVATLLGASMPPDPQPTDTSPDEPDTGPRDDDASDPEDDATTAPVEPTKEDPE